MSSPICNVECASFSCPINQFVQPEETQGGEYIDGRTVPSCLGFEPMDDDLTPKEKALARLAKRSK